MGEESYNSEVGDSPGVSVIMPCYNAAQTLEDAVRSVIAQTYTNWELIVINDGSRDESPAILERLRTEDSRLRVIRNPQPSGASAARNRGLSIAAGRYIAFLDADDLWLPHKLETQLAVMKKHGVALCCGWYDTMDAQGHPMGQVRPEQGVLTHRSLMFDCVIGCLTAVIDRSLAGPVQFDPRLPRGEDYHLWLTILKSGAKGYCVGETLARYRVQSNTLSSNKLAAARTRWQVYRFEDYNLAKSAFYFCGYAVTGMLKTVSMRSHRARQLLGGWLT
jgi:glycosyltransferase involved in cell wall biosynthesis